MSDNPMDKLPTVNRVSIPAILVEEGEDPSAALAEAGFVNAVAIPVIVAEELDLSGGILGNGITPNLIGVLETEQEDEPDFSPDLQSGAARSVPDATPSVEPATTMLPPAFGMQPLAPVRRIG
jgi:hypothetical protein